MRARQSLFLVLVGLTLIVNVPGAWGQMGEAPPARVADLGHDLGRTVTVLGRTGYIVTRFESQGMHVFTLRDDYNDQVMVRTIGAAYPVMGVTYRVTGSPTRLGGNVFLDSAPDLIVPAYPVVPTVVNPMPPPPPPSLQSQVQTWLPTLLSGLAILLVLGYALGRWLTRPQPEWGVLSVTSGPDRGLTVPLRRRRVALGRGVSPAQDVRLSSGDETISNRHALLEHHAGALYVRDMSTNGTRVGGEKLMTGRAQRVNSGDLIHIGTQGTVVIVRLHAAPPAPGLLNWLREAAPLSDKTIMVTEMPPEEPSRQNTSPSPQGTLSVVETAPLLHEPQAAEAFGSTGPDDEDEEDIPHTMAPPLVFTFAGHAPKPGRVFSDNGTEHDREADGDV